MENDYQELAFKYAVEKVNADRSILPRSTLVAQIEKISPFDSFHASKRGKFLLIETYIWTKIKGIGFSHKVCSLCEKEHKVIKGIGFSHKVCLHKVIKGIGFSHKVCSLNFK